MDIATIQKNLKMETIKEVRKQLKNNRLIKALKALKDDPAVFGVADAKVFFSYFSTRVEREENPDTWGQMALSRFNMKYKPSRFQDKVDSLVEQYGAKAIMAELVRRMDD